MQNNSLQLDGGLWHQYMGVNCKNGSSARVKMFMMVLPIVSYGISSVHILETC